jgi:hypothetical protein
MAEDPAAASLATRARARQLVMAGDMAAAVALLQVRAAPPAQHS